jgi:acyl carrier protein
MHTGTEIDRDELRQLVADVLDVDLARVTDDADFLQDLGVDSLIALELAVTLERRYTVRLAEEEIVQLRRFSDVATLLDAKVAG